jgi:excisionase family DNA binding protein
MATVEWMSLDEIADELGVPVRTVYAWRTKGLAPRGYKIGKHVRVKRADLDVWLEAQVDAPRLAS